MPLREIGAKLTLDGEAAWNREMKAADRELANLKSELAATSAEFNGQANTMEALRAKQKLQTQQMEQQTEKVRALEEAVAVGTRRWGENSTQVDKLKQKYNYARASLANMETNLQETNKYLEEAESAADGCATSIDGYGKKVKAAAAPTAQTAGAVEDLADAEKDAQGGAAGLLGGLKKLVPQLDATKIASSLTAAGIATAFKSAWSWAMNLVDSTADLRQSITNLETAASAAGQAFDEDLHGAMKIVYEAAGDMDTAFKTVSQLLQADYAGSGMVKVLDELRGAVIAFPDTMKIDALAEGLQKTLATSSADGKFKEMLARLGVDVDDFNDKLSACVTTAERQDVVLQTLAASGLADMTEEYRNASEASIALSDAQYDLEVANARLAESFEPYAAKVAQIKADFAEAAADMLDMASLGGNAKDMHSLRLSSSKAAGYEGGLSDSEILTTLKTAGMTFDDLKDAAKQAGQSVGEFMNQLHADQVEEVARAAEALAAQEAAAAEAAQAEADAQQAARDALDATKDTVDEALGTLAELEATYDSIRSGIDNMASGFTNLKDATDQYKTTSNDMITALQSQLDYMDSYKDNLLAAQELGLSDALIEEFSDGSAQSAAYLEAIVKDGGEHIQELNAKFAEVEQGKQAFVDTVASALPGFQETIDAVTETLNQAVDDWNQNSAAQAAGANTIQGLLTGLNRYNDVFAMGYQMGQAFEAGYKSAQDQHSPSRVMARAMDFTLDGALLEGERRMGEMYAMGEDMGHALLYGYQRASENAAALLRAETPAAAYSAVSGASGADSGDIKALLQQNIEMMQKIQNLQVVMDTGEVVGTLSQGLDEALGERYSDAKRGLA